MIQTYSNKEKFTQFIFILIPILITQIGLFSMTFIDTTMSGNYRAIDLAGVAIGSSLWVPISTGLTGILIAITPIVSQFIGAKKEKDVRFSVIQGIYVAILLAILVLIIGYLTLTPILNKMDLDPEVRRIAFEYLIALGFGIIPLFVYNVLRSFIDALGKTRVSMLITLSSLPLNILFNYLFIFGKGGFPELGGIGTGYATTITYWFLLLISILIVWKHKSFAHFDIFATFFPFSLGQMREILKIGIPIGLSIFFETSIFSAVTLLMSEFNTITIASNQIAMNFSTLLYMIPLSVSMALTILVGYEAGAQRFQDAKKYSLLGIGFAVTLAILSGLILIFFRTEVAAIYSNNREVIELSTHFLLYALFFQLSDAVQAPIQGALRGYKDVNITFIMSFVSYWIIGLPLGYVLANFTSSGPFGYWIGLISGLAVGAFCLSFRLVIIQKRISLNKKNKALPAS